MNTKKRLVIIALLVYLITFLVIGIAISHKMSQKVKVDTLSTRVSIVEGKVNGIEQRVTDIDITAKKIGDDINSVKTTITESTNRLEQEIDSKMIGYEATAECVQVRNAGSAESVMKCRDI